MANGGGRRSLKTDESFLEKVSIGAVGALKVCENLRSQGHYPIELERGSMSFKIWKDIKIKRVRVPDILSVNSGKRIESRGKSQLEISMSHSESSSDRRWDAGLCAEDYVALVPCKKVGESPVDWQALDVVQYVNVGDMQETHEQGYTVETEAKGAQEGYEKRLQWPCSPASSSGYLYDIANGRIKFKRQQDNRTISLSLTKQKKSLTPQLNIRDRLSEQQIIASVVPIYLSIPIEETVGYQHYLDMMDSRELSDRYAAAKALSYFEQSNVEHKLIDNLRNDNEHLYVRLECASALAKFGIEEGFNFFRRNMHSDILEYRLENVIVLREVDSNESKDMLLSCLLDSNQNVNIRAAAAWALGEMNSRRALSGLIQCFNEQDDKIKQESARAVAKLCRNHKQDILGNFKTANEEERQGIAWALSKSGCISINEAIDASVDFNARQWISYIIGTQDQSEYISGIESLQEQDPELYFAVTVLWKIFSSWVYGLNEY